MLWIDGVWVRRPAAGSARVSAVDRRRVGAAACGWQGQARTRVTVGEAAGRLAIALTGAWVRATLITYQYNKKKIQAHGRQPAASVLVCISLSQRAFTIFLYFSSFKAG